MKFINKYDNNENDGSGSNYNYDVKDLKIMVIATVIIMKPMMIKMIIMMILVATMIRQ